MKLVLTKEQHDRAVKANQIIRDREHLVEEYGFSPWQNKATPLGDLFFHRGKCTYLYLRPPDESPIRVAALSLQKRLEIAEILASEANDFFDVYANHIDEHEARITYEHRH